MIIEKIYISTLGDPSVGIQSSNLVVDTDGTLDMDVFLKEDIAEVLRCYRIQLEKCFSSILDEPVSVLFDFEYEAINT